MASGSAAETWRVPVRIRKQPDRRPADSEQREHDGPFRLTGINIPAGQPVVSAVLGFLRLDYPQAKFTISDTLRATLAAVPDCRSVIVEHGYFDLDSRSEDATTLERQFRFERPFSYRFHLFDQPTSGEDFVADRLTKPDPEEPDRSKAYLGYVMIRRRGVSLTVGRCLLRPRVAFDPATQSYSVNIERRVRTVVREEINLCGQRLRAVGVPFMQQEGVLTRCAHVTAWMAHYTAVLHGIVRRVPVAHLQETFPAADVLFGRQFPSQGLADTQIMHALAVGGLSAERFYLADLTAIAPKQWFHRPAIQAAESHDWHRENFTTKVARYLNSGLPVILGTGKHVELICGYLRRSQLDIESEEDAVEALITQDESSGPYRVRLIQEILSRDSPTDALVFPMPRGLALAGDDAELVATENFERLLNTLNEELGKQGDAARGVRDAVAETIEGLNAHRFAVRTYATYNSDYKESVRSRCGHASELVEMVTLARLPRYVWVTEVIDRALRKQHLPSVVGQIVVDGTAGSSLASAILIHVPGHVESRDPVTGLSDALACLAGPYESGRWAQDVRNPFWYGSLDARVKSLSDWSYV